ncbi:MAG: G4 quadruplex nucleic acid binding protein [Geoglossum umbratile]|nr:MAG: G4 quadruplex nucleic acid binding protein [Geoglossum umbratile]
MTTSLSISPSDPLLTLLQRSFPSAFPPSTITSDTPNSPSTLALPSGSPVQGTNTIVSYLSPKIFPEASYTDIESAEIAQWLTLSARLASPSEDANKVSDLLKTLNGHLSTRTTLLGAKPSVADLTLYSRLAPTVMQWTPEQRTGENGYHHIVRFIDFVQNAPVFGLKLTEGEKVAVDVDNVIFVQKPVDAKEEKDRRKKAAAAALEGESGKAAEGTKSKKNKAKENLSEVKQAVKGVAASANPTASKKEKKEKAPKTPKTPAKEASLTPSLIDLRVGHILKAINHPNADSLYVSTIACGDPPNKEGTSEHEGQVVRTVCSGLNGLVPIEEMQNRKVVVVCNLKPVTMRGVKSSAMVLAASPRPVEGEAPDDGHKGPVELVTPPADAKAGERVFFESWKGEPEGQLNPKKKIWETLQPGFTTTEKREVAFDSAAVPQLGGEGEGSAAGAVKGAGRLVTESGGVCVVKTLTGAVVR